MRSAIHDLLPPGIRRSLSKFGVDLARARRKRRLTVEMMAERVGVAKSTYARIEKGDPAVAMGAYAMVLFVLGFGEALGDLVDARRDEHGLLLDDERLPQRVRMSMGSSWTMNGCRSGCGSGNPPPPYETNDPGLFGR